MRIKYFSCNSCRHSVISQGLLIRLRYLTQLDRIFFDNNWQYESVDDLLSSTRLFRIISLVKLHGDKINSVSYAPITLLRKGQSCARSVMQIEDVNASFTYWDRATVELWIYATHAGNVVRQWCRQIRFSAYSRKYMEKIFKVPDYVVLYHQREVIEDRLRNHFRMGWWKWSAVALEASELSNQLKHALWENFSLYSSNVIFQKDFDWRGHSMNWRGHSMKFINSLRNSYWLSVLQYNRIESWRTDIIQ